MSLIRDINPNSIDLSTNFVGVLGKHEFEAALVKFVKYLVEIDKVFSSHFNRYELELCGFFEEFDNYTGTYPVNIKTIMDYFMRAGYIELKVDNRYVVTDKLIGKMLPFIKK